MHNPGAVNETKQRNIAIDNFEMMGERSVVVDTRATSAGTVPNLKRWSDTETFEDSHDFLQRRKGSLGSVHSVDVSNFLTDKFRDSTLRRKVGQFYRLQAPDIVEIENTTMVGKRGDNFPLCGTSSLGDRPQLESPSKKDTHFEGIRDGCRSGGEFTGIGQADTDIKPVNVAILSSGPFTAGYSQWWWDSENLSSIGRCCTEKAVRSSGISDYVEIAEDTAALDSLVSTSMEDTNLVTGLADLQTRDGTTDSDRGGSCAERSFRHSVETHVISGDSSVWSFAFDVGYTQFESSLMSKSHLDLSDSGLGVAGCTRPSPHTSSPVLLLHSPPVAPLPIASTAEPPPRTHLTLTPNRRPEVTLGELEPVNLCSLYCRERLGGEAESPRTPELGVELGGKDSSDVLSLSPFADLPVSCQHPNSLDRLSDVLGEDSSHVEEDVEVQHTDFAEQNNFEAVDITGERDWDTRQLIGIASNDIGGYLEEDNSAVGLNDPTCHQSSALNLISSLTSRSGDSRMISNPAASLDTDVNSDDVTDNTSSLSGSYSVRSSEHIDLSGLCSDGSTTSSSVGTGGAHRGTGECQRHPLSLDNIHSYVSHGTGEVVEAEICDYCANGESDAAKEYCRISCSCGHSNRRVEQDGPDGAVNVEYRTTVDGSEGEVEVVEEKLEEQQHQQQYQRRQQQQQQQEQQQGQAQQEDDYKDEDNDDVFTESSFCAESDACGSQKVRLPSPLNFAVLFRQYRGERDTRNTQCGDPSSCSASHVGSESDREVLCAERVSQMTKTYNDIEAVTRLLEEKERDLELAARIGQTLLSKNKELAARTETLEEQLSQATERANQLRHEMGMKDELLRFYNEDLERDTGGDTPTAEKPVVDVVNVDFLEKKVKSLEDENLHLRLESANLQSATSNYEDKEKKLVEDCIQQLAEVNQQVETFATELQIKSEENLHQKEEIKTFLSQIAGLQTKIRRLTLDNMDMHEKLTASTESQRTLTKELGTMQDRYDELMEVLEETQDELQLMRSRHRPRSSGGSSHNQSSAYSVPTDSLASELENSLRQEQLGQALGQRRAQSWRVFETAKAAKKAAAKAAQQSSSSTSRMSISASGDATGPSSICDSSQLSVCTSDVESQAGSDGYSGDLDSLYDNSELGRPGIPGSNDLDNALRRLATRRANELNEREFQAREREQQRGRKMSGSSEASMVSNRTFDASGREGAGSGGGGGSTSGLDSPTGSVSSSIWSSATGAAAGSGGAGGQGFKMSDRLQIVKPMEGSMTLRHWKNLANPHLGGLFEQREGIQMKGERKQARAPGESYSISDPEEDDEPRDIHTRKEQDQGLTYTFTDSTVQNFGPYRGLGSLFDSSSSPHLENLTTSSLGTDRLPFGTSTPKLSSASRLYVNSSQISTSAGNVHGKKPASSTSSSYTMSSGLASLLESKESPIVGRSLLRAASIPRLNLSSSGSSSSSSTVSMTGSGGVGFMSLSAKSVASEVSSSNPQKPAAEQTSATSTVSALDLNPSWAAWASRSVGNLSSRSMSSSSIWRQKLPGSGSFEEASVGPVEDSFKREEERVTVSLSNPTSPRRAAIFTPGMTGQGLLQQLKSKGLSLYGLWSGKAENQSSDETDLRRPRLASGTSIDACLDGSHRGKTVPAPDGEECSGTIAETSAESLRPTDPGVLGSLANFNSGGIL